MHVITVKGMKDEGAYAVINTYGEKVVFMFKEKDDASRYAMLLMEQGDPEMEVIPIPDHVAIGACEKSGTKYTVISKDDIVIPPIPKDD